MITCYRSFEKYCLDIQQMMAIKCPHKICISVELNVYMYH